MTSLPTRDQAEDHLFTPTNCALIVIDYEPIQVGSIASMDRSDLVMNIVALLTEACLTFPTLDAIREGYEIYPVVDAVGGTSVEAHRAALERMIQAGARPTSCVQVLCEMQRDWSRKETAGPFAEILFTVEGH